MIMLNVTDFTTMPGARYRADGDASGEEFRDTFLKPRYVEAVSTGERLRVDLDGTDGYATSFLEEAFGGLAREFDQADVLSRIEIKSDEEPRWIENVRRYIRDARGRLKNAQ